MITAEGGHPGKPGPTIVARRWDGLGARLNALVNSWSVARALDLEFRFVWPRGNDPWLNDPCELFSEQFLRSFEITDLECADRIVAASRCPPDLAFPDARDRFHALPPRSFVEVMECFDVLAVAGEPIEDARARFHEYFRDIEWSREIRGVADFVARWDHAGGGSGIHVRAGDIVTGDWRHLVMHEKYVPTPFTMFAIEALSGAEGKPVFVVSDNEPYAAYLKQCFAAVRTSRDILPEYGNLTEVQRALADILLLSQCRRIVGPPSSAFSRLAANLGPGEILCADRLAPEGSERQLLLRGIEEATRRVGRFNGLRPLLARDICWFLDVFGDTLTLAERMRYGRRAVALEPDFCGALNRYARVAALAGRHTAAKRASARALHIARSVTRHSDPLVESLATSIGIECLALGAGRPTRGIRGLARRLCPPSWRERLGWDGQRSAAATLDRLREALTHCERLSPYQMARDGILLNLRYQIAAVEWLTAVDEESREVTRRVLSSSRWERSHLTAWRSGGLHSHRSAAKFDPVVRDLDEVTIRFARGIGEALADSVPRSLARVIGHVEGLVTSVSGLRWARGWAVDASAGGAPVAVGLGQDGGGSACGGPTFAVRKDVAAALTDPRALRCGFWFPVPRDLPPTPGGGAPAVVASTVSGAHAALTPP